MTLPLYQRLIIIQRKFPGQFWIMVMGVFISSAGSSMIWPFLMIYVSGKLHLPISTVATLVTINASTSLVSSLYAGSIADKRGRKIVMVISLMTNGVIYLFMSQADSYLGFAFLMFLTGASNPLYQVGADAMLADLIPETDRPQAYAIQRMANNAGIAIGPAIGGFIASRSYTIAFLCAAAGMITYGVLLIFQARETLIPDLESNIKQLATKFGGYDQVLNDRSYLIFVSLIAMGLIAPSMMWVLLAVYTKTNFGLPESLFGWIPTTNALMCVFLQVFITRISRQFSSLSVALAGMFVYSIGVGSVAIMNHFWGFWFSMVIITFGELMLIPTITTYVANLAPAHLRGRYMSIYWFGWGFARSCSPLIGGFLNDNVSPRAIWVGGLLIGLTSSLGLFVFKNIQKKATRISV
jgi:MFS family permease